MLKYQEMTREELLQEKALLENKFEEIKALNLKLDMSRGKPSAEQLDLSMGILDAIDSNDVLILSERLWLSDGISTIVSSIINCFSIFFLNWSINNANNTSEIIEYSLFW